MSWISALTHRKKSAEEDLSSQAETVADGEQLFVASQWKLMWWKFKKHRLAMASGVVVIFIYLIAIFVEFIAPYDPNAQNATSGYQPPSQIHFVDEAGTFHLIPFIYGITRERDMETLSLVYTEDKSVKYSVRFFVEGYEYKLFGLFPTNRHLFGLETDQQRILLLGADRNGQDVFSRIIYGTRISMSIGLAGVLISFVLGILIGGISGYYGGTIDSIIQRLIEFIRSVPTIPLWMALSAALPPDWSPLQIYFGITLILSLIGWTTLARVVRGRFLAMRDEDFVIGARLDGANQMRIIMLYMVPSFLSHIIAALTLAVPQMILSETALSFLGLGLRFPAISWGVLLQEAQNVRSLALAPWLLTPGIAVVIAVLALNFLGDGIRDAADPYG